MASLSDKQEIIAHNMWVVERRTGISETNTARRNAFLKDQATRSIDPRNCVYYDMVVYLLYLQCQLSYAEAHMYTAALCCNEEMIKAILDGKTHLLGQRSSMLDPAMEDRVRETIVQYAITRKQTKQGKIA